MNKTNCFAILGIFILLIFIVFFCQYIYEERNPEIIIVKTRPKVIIQKIEPLEVTVTSYSPDKFQCQGNPFETASGLIVTPRDLWELKYIAISRDLKKKYNLDWDSSVYIEFKVIDLMGEKAQGEITENTIDIFMRNKEISKQFGKQPNRKIIILEGENAKN